MKLLEKFQKEKISLMKANRENKTNENTAKINVINDILTEIKKECVNQKILDVKELNEDVILNILGKVNKQLSQELTGLKNANRPTDLVEIQQEFLVTFLPKKKDKEETTTIIKNLISEGKNFPEIMKFISKEKQFYDMNLVKNIAKELLQ